jgi:hypothetical protein
MACLREAVQVATRASIPGIAAGSTCLLGQELVVLESWSEAEAHFAEGLRLAHSIGFVTYMAEALEGLASCAAHGGRADSAVALLGASSALRQRHDLPHRQVEEILESPAFAHVQDRLGWEKFSRLWDEGNRMSTEEAAEHGLNGHGQSASLAKGQESQGSSTGFVAT